MKHPDKLTRTILQYPGMILKLHVNLKNGKYHFHNNFSPSILDININSFLTLEVPATKENAMTKSFMIGNGNIGTVVKTMKQVLNSIYDEPKMFFKEDNKLFVNKDIACKHIGFVSIPRLNQALQIIPNVIIDEDETYYEGVHIFVNKGTNIISLAIDEFESLVYILEKSDITALSQLLLNYYISFITDDTLKASKPYSGTTSIFLNKTTSNFRPVEEDSDIFNKLK